MSTVRFAAYSIVEDAMVVTSICLDSDILSKLAHAALRHGVQQSRILRQCVLRIGRRGYRVRHRRSAAYQRCSGRKKIVHIRLSDDLYEAAVDFRRLFKRSVSWLIADEIRYHLSEIIQEMLGGGKSTNYSISHTLFTKIGSTKLEYQIKHQYRPPSP
jgi:hypothetical protein